MRHVRGLWRHPNKYLADEPHRIADVTLEGIAGDRDLHGHGPRGMLTTTVRHGLMTVADSQPPLLTPPPYPLPQTTTARQGNPNET